MINGLDKSGGIIMTDCDNCIHRSLCEKLEVLYMDQCPEHLTLAEVLSQYAKRNQTEYFGPVLAEEEYYEDDMLDQIYHYKGQKTENGYEWENGIVLVPDENHKITIYKANEKGEIASYFPIERMW